MSITAVDNRPAGRLRQQHSERKSEKLEAFWEASPGAVPPGYETHKGAELAFANYCAHEGETRGAIAKRLHQLVHANESGDDYIQATADKAVKGAENSKKKATQRKALAKAEEMARFFFLASIRTLKQSADKPIFDRVQERERMDRARRVLFAHLGMQQTYCVSVREKVQYVVPREKVMELSGVGSNYIAEAHKYLEAEGWIKCRRRAVKWKGPDSNPQPPRYELGDVPEEIKRAFKNSTLYSRFSELKFFTDRVSPESLKAFLRVLLYGKTLTTFMKPVDTSEEKPASYEAIPPHRTFWTYRALLAATSEGFTLSDIQRRTAQSKATVWRHLTILAEMGLARRGECGWIAVIPCAAVEMETQSQETEQAEPIPATYMKLLESIVKPVTPTRTLSAREKIQRDKQILGVGGYYNGADDEFEYVTLATG